MEINKDFPKGRSLFLFIMGLIKINNIIYGSNSASDIIYKNTTVEEKLNAIPVFDPSDNINIEDAKYDYLTYGHIINHLESDAADKVLSAKQGKELKNYIDNIDLSGIDNNANDIGLLNERVDIIEEKMTDNEVITDLETRVSQNTDNIQDIYNSINEICIAYYDENTETLYINNNTTQFIYDASTGILYLQ